MTSGAVTRTGVLSRQLVSGRSSTPGYVAPDPPPPDPDPGPAAPTLSNIAATIISETSVAISWDGDQFTSGQVEYGTTESYGTLSTLQACCTYSSHRQTLRNLTAGTLYHYRIKATNTYSQETVSSDQTFTTPAAPGTPPPDPVATYGPRTPPATPTGGHVYTMASGGGIDLTGASECAAAVRTWLATVPNGTAQQYNIIVIPSGSVLNIATPIVWSSSRRYVRVFGAGYNVRFLWTGSRGLASGGSVMWRCDGADDVAFEGITFDGDWSGAGGTGWGNDGDHGLAFWHGCNNVEVSDCEFIDNQGDGIYFSGWGASQHNDSWVHHNWFYRSGRQNLTLNGGGDDCRVEYNLFEAPHLGCIDWEDTNGTGPEPQSRNRNTVHGNHFKGWMKFNAGTYGSTSPIQFFLRNTLIAQPVADLRITDNLFTVGWLGYHGPSGSSPCPSGAGIIELAQRWAGHNTASKPCGYPSQKTNVVITGNVFDLPAGNGGTCSAYSSDRKQAVRASNSVGLTVTGNTFQAMSIYYASFVTSVNANGCGGDTVPAASSVTVSGNT